MVYNIKKSDGTPLISIPDSTQNTSSTSLILPGRNSVSFGLSINQNFVNLLQNFSNSSAPPNALQGQLWYDSINLELKIYNGNKWVSLTGAFDIASGVGTVQLGPNNIDVTIIISQFQLVSIVSSARIPASDCPDSIIYSDTSYAVASRFPNGIYPGINLATDPTGLTNYMVNGLASSANVLAMTRNIKLTGVASGSVGFDGSKDVEIIVKDSPVYVGNTTTTVAGTWTKVLVNDGGRVVQGNNMVASDIVSVLGYTPYDGSLININSVANTVVARDQNANFAANIIVVSGIIASSGVSGNLYGVSSRASILDNAREIYLNGDVYGSATFDGSKDITISSNLITTGVTAGTYNTVAVDTKGRVINAGWIDHSPYQMISIFPIGQAPRGWVFCNGAVVTFDGIQTQTPDMRGASTGISANTGLDLGYYMKCGNVTPLTNEVHLENGLIYSSWPTFTLPPTATYGTYTTVTGVLTCGSFDPAGYTGYYTGAPYDPNAGILYGFNQYGWYDSTSPKAIDFGSATAPESIVSDKYSSNIPIFTHSGVKYAIRGFWSSSKSNTVAIRISAQPPYNTTYPRGISKLRWTLAGSGGNYTCGEFVLPMQDFGGSPTTEYSYVFVSTAKSKETSLPFKMPDAGLFNYTITVYGEPVETIA